MSKEQLKNAIEFKIERLESNLSRMNDSNGNYYQLQIAISNLYIALSNIK